MDQTSPIRRVGETTAVSPIPTVPIPSTPPLPPLNPTASPPPLPNTAPTPTALPTTLSSTPPPQYYSTQNSVTNDTQNSHTLRNIFLTALGLGCLLLFTSVGYVYWTFVRPRWYLATAISNLTTAKSYHFRADMPLIKESSLTIEGDRFYDTALPTANKIAYTTKGDLNQTVTTTVDSVEDGSSEYLKPSSTHMNQMYNQLLSLEPYLSEDPALAALQPVLHGKTWAHYSASASAKTEIHEPYSVQPFEIFVLLALGTKINSYEPSMQIGDEEYAHYTLGLQNAAVVSFLDELKDRNITANVADINRIIDAINQSNSADPDVLTIVVDKKIHAPHLITLTLPEKLLSIITEEIGNTDELISPFLSASENPLELVQWFRTGTVGPHLSIEFSEYNQVAAVQPPTDILEVNSIENAPELLGYIISYLSSPTMSQSATGKENAFNTANHESKLLFNQGKYAEGLSMASKSLTLAETDEDKAYAYYWMGLHTYKLGKSTEAEPLLLKAASLLERYAGPYVTLGAISADRGNFEQMKTYSLTCIEYDPQYAWCYNNLGLAYAYLGKPQEAIPQLEKAVSLDPLNFVFNDNLKRVKANQ